MEFKVLVLGHILGDFFFQSEKVAKEKEDSKQNKAFAEKYLVGTLISTLIAMLCVGVSYIGG